MNQLTQLSANQLRRAADLQEQIESLQGQLTQLLGAPAGIGAAATPKKRHMSAAARARIAAGARARWAKIKGTAAPARKPKRTMSAAAKARLSALAKARWKKAKAAGKTTL